MLDINGAVTLQLYFTGLTPRSFHNNNNNNNNDDDDNNDNNNNNLQSFKTALVLSNAL
jgi:hypothetical protein